MKRYVLVTLVLSILINIIISYAILKTQNLCPKGEHRTIAKPLKVIV